MPGFATITNGLRASMAASASLMGMETSIGVPGGVVPATAKNSVAIGPGHTAVTRTLVEIVSPQRDSVNERTYALVAE